MAKIEKIENYQGLDTAQQKENKRLSQRVQHITFVISIDYFLRGLKQQNPNYVVKPYQFYYDGLLKNFEAFLERYGMKGIAKVHDKDFKQDSILALPTEEPDDNHMHFIAIGGSQVSLTDWGKRLDKYGLPLSKTQNLQKLQLKNLPKATAYLLHLTPASFQAQKHQYSIGDIYAFGFDEKYIQKLVDKGSFGGTISDNRALEYADKYTVAIQQGKLSLEEVREKSKKIFGTQQSQFWRRYGSSFEKEYSHYIDALFYQLTFRRRNFSFIYITGASQSGKSNLANKLAYFFADKELHAVHTTAAPGRGKTFDLLSTYNNELVTVGHELRGTGFGVDEFENLFEPDRYPTGNSRTADKHYLAQAFILAQAKDPKFWAYELLYYDYLVDNKACSYYGYQNAFSYQKEKYSFPFPRTYAQLNNLGRHEKGKMVGWKEKHFFADSDDDLTRPSHWTFLDASRFLDDWWQILRRIGFVIRIEDGKVELLKLNEKTAPYWHITSRGELIGVKNNMELGDQFFEQFDFYNHFEVVSIYSIDGYDVKSMFHLAKCIFKDLTEKCSVKVEDKLPKLWSQKELDSYFEN